MPNVNPNSEVSRGFRMNYRLGFAKERTGGALPRAREMNLRDLKGRDSPSWGDCFLSVDLTSDDTSATGGRPRFVPGPSLADIT